MRYQQPNCKHIIPLIQSNSYLMITKETYTKLRKILKPYKELIE
jgi:hypothetical protein